MSKEYILNKETQKIELHFTKEEYNNISDNLKKELKSNFLWSNYGKCWVSRSKNNHYYALQVSEKLGFTNGGSKGERLSYEEELQQKAERAERKEERYLNYAQNAKKRAENLQKELNSYHGDIAFFTQPIIAGHAGSQRFKRQRDRIYDRYHKGFEEYKKSEHFHERASTVRKTANMEQLKKPIYLNNRIKECKKNIRQLEKNVNHYEEIIQQKKDNNNFNDLSNSFYNNKSIEQIENYLNETLEKMEYTIDKLAFFENCMDEINNCLKEKGKKIYIKEDLKPGYLYQTYRFNCWAKVNRVNPKTVTGTYINHPLTGHDASCDYAEIKEIKIPDDWKEEKFKNPFNVNDIFVLGFSFGDEIRKAYQTVKTTNKCVIIQEIELDENKKPLFNKFKENSLQQRKQVIKRRFTGEFVIYVDDYILNKYTK